MRQLTVTTTCLYLALLLGCRSTEKCSVDLPLEALIANHTQRTLDELRALGYVPRTITFELHACHLAFVNRDLTIGVDADACRGFERADDMLDNLTDRLRQLRRRGYAPSEFVISPTAMEPDRGAFEFDGRRLTVRWQPEPMCCTPAAPAEEKAEVVDEAGSGTDPQPAPERDTE